MTRHPSDTRWNMTAPAARPTIRVLDADQRTDQTRRMLREGARGDGWQLELVPFGFVRALLDDEKTGQPLCGWPHARRPRVFGGCDLPLHHTGTHRWRGGGQQPVAIRPTRGRETLPEQRARTDQDTAPQDLAPRPVPKQPAKPATKRAAGGRP